MSRVLDPRSTAWDWDFQHIAPFTLLPGQMATPITWKEGLDDYYPGWVERGIVSCTNPLLWMRLTVRQATGDKVWFAGTVADLLALGRGPWSPTLNPTFDGFFVEVANPVAGLYVISFMPRHLSRPYRELTLTFRNNDPVNVASVIAPSVVTRIILLRKAK